MKRNVLLALACAVILATAIWVGLRPKPSKKTIAFVVPTLSIPFFVDMTRAAQDAAANGGATLLVQASTDFTNVEQQVTLIENVISLKVDALCLVAADSKGVVPALRKVQDAKIPIVLVDNTLDPATAKAAGVVPNGHVGSDNVLGGKLAGDFIGNELRSGGEVAMLEGVLGSDVANARKQGFVSALQGFPQIHLVASQTANYSREQGLDVFQNMLQAKPNIKALFAANDEMALGAIKALERSPRKDRLSIVGFDATADGLAAVKNGTMRATVQQQPKEMGQVAVDLALRATRGDAIPRETNVPVKLVTAAD